MGETCDSVSLDTWLEVMVESMVDFAVTMLGLDEGTVLLRESGLNGDQMDAGDCVALIRLDALHQIGLGVDITGCKALAGAMLQIIPENVTSEDIADTLSEMANIMAGMVKRKLTDDQHVFEIGLPVFLDAPINFDPQEKVSGTQIMIGETEVLLLLVRNN